MVNLFFVFSNTLPQHKLRLVSFYIKDKALTWFQDLDESSLLNDWDMFVKALLIRFGLDFYDDPMESQMRLKQSESIKNIKHNLKTCLTG